jgi:UDP-N-acetylglucosamine:LPS N-acetylglucosamine transferase
LPTLSYKLDRLLADPQRFKSMQANARLMGHPNAAKEIVDQLAAD